MGGLALVEGHARRRIPATQMGAVKVGHLQHAAELVGGDHSDLGVGFTEHELGGLVVERQRAAGVDEDRSGQIGRELTSEYQGEAAAAGPGRVTCHGFGGYADTRESGRLNRVALNRSAVVGSVRTLWSR